MDPSSSRAEVVPKDGGAGKKVETRSLDGDTGDNVSAFSAVLLRGCELPVCHQFELTWLFLCSWLHTEQQKPSQSTPKRWIRSQGRDILGHLWLYLSAAFIDLPINNFGSSKRAKHDKSSYVFLLDSVCGQTLKKSQSPFWERRDRGRRVN